jgi:hypothetical protein
MTPDQTWPEDISDDAVVAIARIADEIKPNESQRASTRTASPSIRE